MIPQCDTLCDVGCDHGYLPIEAVSRGICEKAYALDVRKGPLERARINVEEAGLSEKIILRLSDGLDKMSPGEADVISIAGMGGPLMQDILTRGREVSRRAKSLVLSPQSHLADFRSFLCDEGYHISGEELVFDEGKYYFVMALKYSDGEKMVLNDFELRYGKVDHEKLRGFLSFEHRRLSGIMDNLKKNSLGGDRLREIEREMEIISNYSKDIPFS